MKNIILTSLLVFFYFPLSIAQTDPIQAHENSYSLVKIYNRNNQTFIAKNLTFVDDSTVSFIRTATQKSEKVSINNLRTIKVKTGTKMVNYALFAGGIGVAASLLAVASTEANPNYSAIESNYGPFFAVTIIGSTVIGGIIGILSPKWTTLSLPRKESSSSFIILYPEIDMRRNEFALSVKYNF